jgi:predicted nucleotidyltransferase
MGTDAATIENDPRLRRLVQTVVDALHPRAVFLFGSRAEGHAADDSDYDLMAVLPDDAPSEALDPFRACELSVLANVPADIIPVRMSTFLYYRGAPYSLPGHVHELGHLLYGSAE